MSIDLRCKHDRLLRERAAELFDRRFGYRSVARRLGISARAVRKWQQTYRAVGRDGLLNMGKTHAKYDFETKVAAAGAVVDGGMPKPKGRPGGSGAKAAPRTREQELEERVRKLEAQVAYLKKSIALKAELRSRTGRRP